MVTSPGTQRDEDGRVPRVGFGRRLRRHPLTGWAITQRRAWTTRRAVRREPHRFDAVETCCLFVGHVKCGGSLLGAMLDAHPDAVVADEVDIVAQVTAGLDHHQIFTLLERGAAREAAKGRVTARRLTPYSLAVPGQWQGRSARPRVMGDSRAGPTTRTLAGDPRRLDRLYDVLGGTRTAFVHVVRNPFESIGAMVRRSGRPVPAAIEDHRQQCRRLMDLRVRIGAEDLITVRYEDLVAAPRHHLGRTLDFLGLEVADAHLAACAALVGPGPVRERELISWSDRDLDEVRRTIDTFTFLDGYGFDR
jgi:hypothetical protein